MRSIRKNGTGYIDKLILGRNRTTEIKEWCMLGFIVIVGLISLLLK